MPGFPSYSITLKAIGRPFDADAFAAKIPLEPSQIYRRADSPPPFAGVQIANDAWVLHHCDRKPGELTELLTEFLKTIPAGFASVARAMGADAHVVIGIFEQHDGTCQTLSPKALQLLADLDMEVNLFFYDESE